MIDDIELREIFKTASQEHLEALDQGLLQLEKQPDDPDLLEALLREAHSLKGDSTMLGVSDLSTIAHQVEQVLESIQRGDRPLSADLGDRLSRSIAAMAQLAQAAVTGDPAPVQVFYVLADLMGADPAPADTLPPVETSEEANDLGFLVFDDAVAPPAVTVTVNANGNGNGRAARSDRYLEDDELRDIFRVTSDERLQALDEGLLHLEKHPGDRDSLEALLREAHSLKGDGNMLGVADVGAIAHQIEHILTAIQRGDAELSGAVGDSLSQGLVTLRQLIQEATTGEPTGVDVSASLERLRTVCDRPAVSLPATADPVNGNGNGGAALAAIGAPVPAWGSGSNGTSPDPANGAVAMASGDSGGVDRTADYRIETLRVPTQSLDTLMTQMGELTVTKTRVAHRLGDLEAIAVLQEDWGRDVSMNRFLFYEAQQGKPVWQAVEQFYHRTEQRLEQLSALVHQLSSALGEDTARLETIADDLAEGIRTLRLLPLSTIFNLFPRLVRDLARQQGKQIDLVIEGGDIRADKRILEEMKDPLLHMLRNAVDHGVESPDERQRQGKPAVATIRLRGYRTATTIGFDISDDGRGLDLEAIRRTAIQRGLCRAEDLERLTPDQIQALILSPGFSTRTVVSEISGRGVGLDVLRTKVERLKGTVEVRSTPGQGCTLSIQLGTALTTDNVLLIRVSGQTYALPVEFVHSACLIRASDMFDLEGHRTIVHNDEPLSVVWLADLLNLPQPEEEHRQRTSERRLACLILQVGHDRVGVCVDALVDEQEVVLKPQSRLLKRVRHVLGATILATGEVCMVLNPQDLVATVRSRGNGPVLALPTESGAPAVAEVSRARRILLVEDSIATRTQEKRILESAGYEVVTAVDGLDGFNKLQASAFDAVVSDVQMPNLDGLGLTQRIRQHREYSDLPVVLITTLSSEADLRRGAEAGANAYIPKGSFTQDVLFETLDRLI